MESAKILGVTYFYLITVGEDARKGNANLIDELVLVYQSKQCENGPLEESIFSPCVLPYVPFTTLAMVRV